MLKNKLWSIIQNNSMLRKTTKLVCDYKSILISSYYNAVTNVGTNYF